MNIGNSSPFRRIDLTGTFADHKDAGSVEFNALINAADPYPGSQSLTEWCNIPAQRLCYLTSSPTCVQCAATTVSTACHWYSYTKCPDFPVHIGNDAEYSAYLDRAMKNAVSASTMREGTRVGAGPKAAWPSYLVLDVDGDGRDDIVTHQTMGDPSGMIFTTPYASHTGKRLTDINPALAAPTTINMHVFRSTGEGFERQSYPTRCFSNEALLADVDSDGRRDVVCCDKRGLYVERPTGTGGFHGEEYVSRPADTKCEGLVALDMDGDGAEELVNFSSVPGRDAHILERAPNGTYSWRKAGFPEEIYDGVSEIGELKESCGKLEGTTCSYYSEELVPRDDGMIGIMKLDVNGDGLRDVFHYGRLWINTGRGFISGIVNMPWTRRVYFDRDSSKLVVFDYDNDGRDDIVNWFSGEILRATARGELEYQKILEPTCGDTSDYVTQFWPLLSKVVLADLNGDGTRDWVCSGTTSDEKYRVGTAVLWGRHTEAGALVSVQDGVGKRVDIAYRDDGTSGPGATLAYQANPPGTPIADVARVRRVSPVVSRYVESQRLQDGAGGTKVVLNARHSFRYQNANYGLNGRGWYGFESMREVITNPDGELFERTDRIFNNRVFWNAGTVEQVIREYATVAPGIGHDAMTRFDWTLYDWRQFSTPWSQHGQFVAPQSVTHSTIENSHVLVHESTIFGYDDFGNVSTKGTTIDSYQGTQQDWSLESVRFLPILPRWVVTNVGDVEIRRAFGADVQSRKLSYSYYPNGLLDATVREPDSTAYRQTTKLVRDNVYWNVIETRVTDVAGTTRSAGVSYDSRGRYPVRESNALGHETEVQYDLRTGQLLTTMDPNGVIVQRQYDMFGRKTRELGPVDELIQQFKATSAAYGKPAGAISVSVTVSGGLASRWNESTLDATGALLMRSTRGLGGAIVTEEVHRDWAGRVLRATLPHVSGDTSQGQRGFVYDAMGRLTLEMSPDGRTVEYGYPTALTANAPYSSLFAASTQNPVSARIAIQPNGRGEIEVIDRRGLAVMVGHWDEEHSPSGAYSVLDGTGARSTYRYDAMGQIVEVVDPDGENSMVGYDAIGRRTVTFNPTIGQRTYEYNGFDEVAKYTDAEHRVTCHYYDELGRPRYQIEGDSGGDCSLGGGSLASFTYDGTGTRENEVGRLVSTWRRSRPGATDGTTTTYRYEPRPAAGPNVGRLASVTQQVPGIVTPLVTSLQYEGPWVRRVNYPSADGSTFAVEYGHDAVGAVTEVRDGTTMKRYWAATEFDGGMRIKREVFGNDVETEYEYHGVAMSPSGPRCIYGATLESCSPGAIRRMVTRRNAAGALPLRNLEYEYEKQGLVSGITTVRNAGERDKMAYSYDYLGRLRRESHWIGSSQLEATWWDYTNGGDILRVRNDLTGATLQSYSYGDSTRRHLATAMNDQSFEHNLNGSQTHRRGTMAPSSHQVLEYNEFEMPWRISTSLTGSTSLEYDAIGERVAKRGPSRTTVYAGKLYECDGLTPGVGGSFDCENHRYSIFANGRQVAVVSIDTIGEQTVEYIHGDHLGSSAMTTNKVGAVARERRFAAFGATASSVGDSLVRSGFTGHEHDDELGLINMRGRLYDPRLARFISADPYVTKPLDTQGLNRYSYVRNSPLSFVDPSGFYGAPSSMYGGGSFGGGYFGGGYAPGGWTAGPGVVGASAPDSHGNYGYAFGADKIHGPGRILADSGKGSASSHVGGSNSPPPTPSSAINAAPPANGNSSGAPSTLANAAVAAPPPPNSPKSSASPPPASPVTYIPYVANYEMPASTSAPLPDSPLPPPSPLEDVVTAGRAPDFVTGSLNVTVPTKWTGDWFSVGISFTIDRAGQVYGGLGGGAGKTPTTYSASLVGGWLNQTSEPSPAQLERFLSGHAGNALFTMGNYALGGVLSPYGGDTKTATTIGVATPQSGAGYSYSWSLGKLW